MTEQAIRFSLIRERINKIPQIEEGDSENQDSPLLNRRLRREQVIGAIAQRDIRDESLEVQDTAIQKYFIHHLPDIYTNPVVVSAVHAQNESPLEYAIEEIAAEAGIGWIAARKKRLHAEINRPSFLGKERGKKAAKLSQDPTTKPTLEFPTSGRAAWYWLVQRAIEKTVGFDENGHVNKPFLNLSLHGSTDRNYVTRGELDEFGDPTIAESIPVDLVIGGGNLVVESEVADPEVIKWFAHRLATKISEANLRLSSSDRLLNVAIEYGEPDQAIVFKYGEAGEIQEITRDRVMNIDGKKSDLSGKGLGLEHFRDGRDFDRDLVKTLGTDLGKIPEQSTIPENTLRFSGFGKGFSTVQLEILKSVRQDNPCRQKLDQILSELCTEFGVAFPNIS